MRSLPGLVLLVFAAFAVPASAVEWKPVTDAELAMKAPKVDKDADAEAIFWEVRVVDELQGQDLQTTRSHYLRIKIFTEKGRDNAKVELAYGRKSHVTDVSGPTIKADGRIIPMKKDAIFDADVVKGKGLRIQSRSFTLPDVQPGDIVEYQWKEIDADTISNYLRLPLQRDIPVETVRYMVKPFSSQYINIGMQSMTFHVEKAEFKPGLQGFSVVEYNNMPAFKEEPDMPPADELRAWVLVFYTDGSPRNPDKYWLDYGRKVYGLYKEEMKVNGDIRQTASQAAAGDTDDAKIRALYAWMHKNIRNVNTPQVTADERRAYKPNKSSIDTFRQRIGTGYDINLLFGALATAAGFEVRVALTGDRSQEFFSPRLLDRYFLRGELIAVKIGEKWRYFDPASPWLGAGWQIWEQQGTPALLTDSKKPEWLTIDLSRAADSLQSNTGRLKLDAEGSLSGTFATTYTGHLAVNERRELFSKSASEREQYLIDDMKRQYGSPEISDVKWEGVEDSETPLKVTFRMKIPNYTQRTGKRLFIQPAVFEYNNAARFPNSARRHPVYFHYPWSEADDITIDVPEGYEFDHPDLPGPVLAGKTAEWRVTAAIHGKTQLVYQRQFQFADDGNIILPQTSYPVLKRLFDAIHEGDEHTIALKLVQTN